METMVDSTDRGAKDYFHFGLTCSGVILCAVAIVTLSRGAGVFGLILVALGLAYFLVQIWGD